MEIGVVSRRGLRSTLLDGGNEGLTLTGKGASWWWAPLLERPQGHESGRGKGDTATAGAGSPPAVPPGNPDSGPEAGTGATLTRNNDLNNQRLEFQLSYGLPAFGDRFTLTPELGLGFYDNGRDYRLGWSLTNRMVGSRLPSPST